MGYRIPNQDARDVYRYIFRVGQREDGGLSDGFSWSILFLNDTSPTCMEFLSRYGVELCHRTADRIRFVFFSGLDGNEVGKMAELAKRYGGGFISRILSGLGHGSVGSRRYDRKHSPWEEFRPSPFYPLDSPEDINHHVSPKSEIISAMPGSGEAMRLAQQLGIGRFVPCFLLFSDVGSPTVRLFPVARKTPEQIFERLRKWIDSFYEINNNILRRWDEIEHRIEETCQKFRTPIAQVNRWRIERHTRWQTLQRLTMYVNRLANGSPDTNLVRELAGDWKLSAETRTLVTPFVDRFVDIERKEKLANDLTNSASKMRKTTDPQVLYNELLGLHTRGGWGLPSWVEDVLDEPGAQKQFINLGPPPELQIWEWWASPFGRPLSRNRYDKLRCGWVNYSKVKHGPQAVGNVADILKREFELVIQIAMAQPVSCIPEHAAAEVLGELASYLGVLANDPFWDNCTSAYRKVLTEYFGTLAKHAPPWLIEMGSRLSPVLAWGDCVPLAEQRQAAGLRQCIEYLPRLNQLAIERRRGWDSTISKLIAAIDKWLSAAHLMESDRQATWQTLLVTLSHVRHDLEKRVFESAKNDISAAYPGRRFSRNDAADLLQLLGEYDAAIESIELPFCADREVLKVELKTPLVEASGVTLEKSSHSAADRLRKELDDAINSVEKSVAQWNKVKEEAGTWNPAAMLCQALNHVLGPRRLEEIVAGLGAEGPRNKINALASRSQVIRLLDTLSVQEMLGLERQVSSPDSPLGKAATVTKQELHDSILLGIGLLPSSVPKGGNGPKSVSNRLESLRAKVRCGDFDVFLAHNSRDKELVLRLGQELRNQGIHAWIDVEQVPPGRWFQDIIQSAVRSVKTAAIVIGGDGIGRWQALELRTFVSQCVEKGIPLIPVLLPGVEAIPDDLAFLRELNLVKFVNEITEEDAMSRLVWGITGEKPEVKL